MKTQVIPEPRILLGDKKQALDPRLGLTAYGPSGIKVEEGQYKQIRAGAIGTPGSLNQLASFLERLRSPIKAVKNTWERPWNVDFPGLGIRGPLGFDIEVDPACVKVIEHDEETTALYPKTRPARTQAYLELYERKFGLLESSTNKAPDLVILPLSQKFIDECKDPSYDIERIVYARRTMQETADGAEPPPLFDFHNAIKVISFQRHMTCQVIRPRSLTLTEASQDASTVAWNFAAAAYYKGTDTPWKLAQLDDRTCIVGISFFQDHTAEGKQVSASMAHVFMGTGESQIIRGKPFTPAKVEGSKHTYLTRDAARQLLVEIREFLTGNRLPNPDRLVLHKTSPFTDEEKAGFDEGLGPITHADYIHIESRPDARFYHDGHKYPPVRGCLIYEENASPIFLYASGYVPALDTYQGSTVPNPLALHPKRMDSDVVQVARDILTLTKLDWNSTDFCGREPVTISVSRKVGEILSEMRAKNLTPPAPYRYYM